MVVFSRDRRSFEAGDTITSEIWIADQDSNIISANVVDGEHQVEMEVIDIDTEETVVKKNMEHMLDDDDNSKYVANWFTEESDRGEFYIVHRAWTGDDNNVKHKMTRIVDIVVFKDSC